MIFFKNPFNYFHLYNWRNYKKQSVNKTIIWRIQRHSTDYSMFLKHISRRGIRPLLKHNYGYFDYYCHISIDDDNYRQSVVITIVICDWLLLIRCRFLRFECSHYHHHRRHQHYYFSTTSRRYIDNDDDDSMIFKGRHDHYLFNHYFYIYTYIFLFYCSTKNLKLLYVE